MTTAPNLKLGGHAPTLLNRFGRIIGTRARGLKGVDFLLRLMHHPDHRHDSWFETIEQAIPNGPRFYLSSRWFNEWTVYFYGQQDALLHRWILKNIRKDSIAIDVGANFGYYSCLLGSQCRAVHAFEPVPWLRDRTERNVMLNDLNNVTIIQAALSDHEGMAKLNLPADDACNWGVSSLTRRLTSAHITVDVATTTLDNYIAKIGTPVDFIKIDVEGAEHLVLKGGVQTLERHRPLVIFERNDESEAEVMDIFRKLRYQFYDLEGVALENKPSANMPDDVLAVPG